LITDSLPAIALGMDPKASDIMKEKPRDPNEGIFANGGLKTTVVYGAILTISVLLAYFSCGWINGVYKFSEMKALFETNADVLHQAQTMAFTTLALSELFHMIGMSNVNRSVVGTLKNKNKMMLIAFVVGFLLQLLVIEVSAVSAIFSTFPLTSTEWIITAVLSLIPLIAHELIVFVKWIAAKKAN
jgi:Ca2+-transporting ATPase